MGNFNGNGEAEYRGSEGPLKIGNNVEEGALYDSIIETAGEFSLDYNADCNGAQQDRIGMTQTTIRKSRRMSTAFCFLDPARCRAKLKILLMP